MHLLITPRRLRGVTLSAMPVKRTTMIKGDLVISNRLSEALNRHSNVASLKPLYGAGQLLLPELYDATVSAMATEGFTVSGIEFDGERWYAQSWWCRPVHQ